MKRVLIFLSLFVFPATLLAQRQQSSQAAVVRKSFRDHKAEFDNQIGKSPEVAKSICIGLFKSLSRSSDLRITYLRYQLVKNNISDFPASPKESNLADALKKVGFESLSDKKTVVEISNLDRFPDGSIIVSQPGSVCGPDERTKDNGSFFVKCGDFLVGSGVIRMTEYKRYKCNQPEVLFNEKLAPTSEKPEEEPKANPTVRQ